MIYHGYRGVWFNFDGEQLRANPLETMLINQTHIGSLGRQNGVLDAYSPAVKALYSNYRNPASEKSLLVWDRFGKLSFEVWQRSSRWQIPLHLCFKQQSHDFRRHSFLCESVGCWTRSNRALVVAVERTAGRRVLSRGVGRLCVLANEAGWASQSRVEGLSTYALRINNSVQCDQRRCFFFLVHFMYFLLGKRRLDTSWPRTKATAITIDKTMKRMKPGGVEVRLEPTRTSSSKKTWNFDYYLNLNRFDVFALLLKRFLLLRVQPTDKHQQKQEKKRLKKRFKFFQKTNKEVPE